MSCIDFDQWAALARAQPAAFEAQRAALLERTITALPAARQARLRALQWRVDQLRRRTHTPLAACVILTQWMRQSAYGPQGLCAAWLAPRRAPRQATILRFPPAALPLPLP